MWIIGARELEAVYFQLIPHSLRVKGHHLYGPCVACFDMDGAGIIVGVGEGVIRAADAAIAVKIT